jgi:hypothetical protein
VRCSFRKLLFTAAPSTNYCVIAQRTEDGHEEDILGYE